MLADLLAACLDSPTYLDKFYALQPGRPNGAKRLVVLLPLALRAGCDPDWVAAVGDVASIAWRGDGEADDLDPHEFVCADQASQPGQALTGAR